jgi:DNA-binding SARP family transcriptional activator
MKSRIAIRLFGKFSVHCGEQELLVHTSGKAKVILAYLAVNRRAPVLRESLADLISDESSPEKSRKALRQALWQLHEGVGCNKSAVNYTLIDADKRWAQLARGEHLWVDVDEFEHAARTPGDSGLEPSPDTKSLRHAVELYRGEFLQGWHQEWCVSGRERLRQIYLKTLDRLLLHFEAEQNGEAGIAYATLALGVDPARECTHRSLMRLYSAAGDRSSALHQYERCCAALRNELGIGPDANTRALEKEVRAGQPSSDIGQTPTPMTRIGERVPPRPSGVYLKRR